MASNLNAHPQSVHGDFYVENGCCLACGVPQAIAPDLIGEIGEEFSHCYWKKQPETPEELERAICLIHAQEVGCHRYAGSNTAILPRLPEDCCDHFGPSVYASKRPVSTFDFKTATNGVDFSLAESKQGLLGRLRSKLSRKRKAR